MKIPLELQDELFGLFINDKDICTILGINDSTNIPECSTKIRRELQTAALANDGPSLFFVYTWIPSLGAIQDNYKVNRNTLEFIIYGKYRAHIVKLYKAIKKVMQTNFEDFQIVSEGQVDSPITGLTSYCFRVRPLTLT